MSVEIAPLPEARSQRAHRRLLKTKGLGARRVEDAVDGVLRVEIVGQRSLDLVRGQGI